MKTIKLAKRWQNRVNDTTVHEYPAGWSGQVSNEVAERAAAAGVLDGKAVEVPEGRPARAAPAKKSAVKKTVKSPAPTSEPTAAPAASEPATEA